jgi:hypothetical protein
MSNFPFLLSNRERVNSPLQADPQRYQFLDIRNAEPNFGVPVSTAKPISATYILTVDLDGTRRLLSTRTIDSAYTFLNINSAGYLSNYTTVNRNSGSWVSTYSTLLANSGTWLTEPSASSLYFKLTGGDITGNLNILGNVLIFGALSALSGLNYITTNATTTSALSVVNIGIGPALYVQQDGAYDIAQFWDKEGGIAMVVGNIAPPGPYAGVVGIKTTSPNETLTVVGTISASKEIYTQTGFYSAGVSIQRLFDNAYLPKLESSYSTVDTNSASWSSVYSSWFNTSARYTTVDYLSTNLVFLSSAIVTSDLVVRGSFFAQGSAYFANTIITTTSALSVINTGPGPALYVYQGAGGGDIASFYDGDGLEVLHVGNALSNPGIPPRGVIGIKTSFPHRELTVVGEVSASSFINNLQIVYDNQTMFLGRSTNNTNAGLQNIFIGEDPGKSNQFGSDNIFIGYRAGYSNVDANSNVFIGTQAGQNNVTGTQNVYLGYSAGSNGSGNSNICLGWQAGNSVAGNNNVIIGYNAGQGAVASYDNIILGSNADVVGSPSNVLVIGKGATVDGNNQLVIGNPSSKYNTGTIWTNTLSINNILSAQQTSVVNLTGTVSRFNNSQVLTRFISNNITELSGTIGLSGTNYFVGTQVISGTNTIRGITTISGSLSAESLSARFLRLTQNLPSTSKETGTLVVSGGVGVIGTVTAEALSAANYIGTNVIRLSSNTIYTTDPNTDLNFIPNGTGIVRFERPPIYTKDPNATGPLSGDTLVRFSYVQQGARWVTVSGANRGVDASGTTFVCSVTAMRHQLNVSTRTATVTCALPLNMPDGMEVRVLDGGKQAATRNITISAHPTVTINGIQDGVLDNILKLDKNGSMVMLVYSVPTDGGIPDWKLVGIV